MGYAAGERPEVARLEELLVLFSGQLRDHPGDLQTRLKRAEVLRLLGRVDEAVKAYREVAWAQAAAGNLVQAIMLCKLILDLRPEHQDTQQMLARLYGSKRAREVKRAVPVARLSGRWVAAAPTLRPDAGPAYVGDAAKTAQLELDDGAAPLSSPSPAMPAARVVGTHHEMSSQSWLVTPAPGGAVTVAPVSPAEQDPAERDRPTMRVDCVEPSSAMGPPQRRWKETAPMPGAQASRLLRMDAELAYGEQRGGTRAYSSIQREVRGAVESACRPDPSPSPSEGAARCGGTSAGAVPPAAAGLPSEAFVPAEGDPAADGIPAFPIFSGLGEEAFLALLGRLERRVYAEGSLVLVEGTPGDSLFLVATGALRVTKQDADGSTVELGRLAPGAIFGEFGVLTDQRRHATVTCVEEAELLELTRPVLAELVRAHPAVGETVEALYEERVLQMVMNTSSLFRAVCPEERDEVVGLFCGERFPPDATVVAEGQPVGAFYVVLLGELAVTCRGDDGQVHELGVLREGDYFGEMSLITGREAGASVRTRCVTDLLKLGAGDFYDLAARHPEVWAEVERGGDSRQAANDRLLAARRAKACLF
ncbi:MAG: cyclic nucleotide-binding domain-containing protein [Deltaproteobacteria bacterium]|nr:cyclic nucleotide-binding domain-containing protein [Deltaproteobacteria bacterium]